VAGSAAAERGVCRAARFSLAKFRPTTLPATLVPRSALHGRLTAGAGKRLTGKTTGATSAMTGKTTEATSAMTGKTVVAADPGCSGSP
jgi:hypothetical protein